MSNIVNFARKMVFNLLQNIGFRLYQLNVILLYIQGERGGGIGRFYKHDTSLNTYGTFVKSRLIGINQTFLHFMLEKETFDYHNFLFIGLSLKNPGYDSVHFQVKLV